MQEIVRQSFGFEQEAKSVNGVFEITLGGCFRALLKQEEVVLHLVGIQFGGQTPEMQRHGGHVPRIVLEGFAATSQY